MKKRIFHGLPPFKIINSSLMGLPFGVNLTAVHGSFLAVCRMTRERAVGKENYFVIKPHVVIIANAAFGIYRFRRELISHLIEQHVHVTILAARDRHVDDLLKLGADFVPWNLSRTSLNLIREVWLFFSLYRILLRLKPSCVMNTTIKPVIYGSFACDWASIPVVSMITGLGYVFTGNSLKQRLLRFFIKKLYRMALARNVRVLFQNPDDADFFIKEQLVDETKTLGIGGSGVDLISYSPQEKPKLRSKCIFVMVARLLIAKGVPEYCAAAKIVRAKHADCEFWLVGHYDDNPSSISKKLLEDYMASGAIEYLGERQDVAAILQKADVFVLPSHREGTSRATLEALASGLPVITTNAVGCRETVVEGINGFMIPVGDAEALARACERFIETPSLRVTMGEKSRALAEEKFDVRIVNETITHALTLAINLGEHT